jgi:hypothetical protein
MNSGKFALAVGAAVTIAFGPGAVAGWAQNGGAQRPSAKAEATAATQQFRTAWGDPDFEGIWGSGYIETPVERPDSFNGREFLTDADARAEQKRLDDKQDHSTGGTKPVLAPEGSARPVDFQPYNTAWSGRGREVIRTKRTSQIVDPPDGKIPWKAGIDPKSVLAVKAVGRQGGRDAFGGEFAGTGSAGEERANPEDLGSERCMGVMLPIRYGDVETGGAHQRIVQTPGHIKIYHEYGPHGGTYRTIWIDGRPHLPPTLQQWLGDSIGRFDGNTLVVDTTNFTDRTPFWGARDKLHLVERYVRTAPDLIMYYATIEDPTVYARPWTIEIPLTQKDAKANQIYEAACHEGNYGLTGILGGAREREREAAAAAKSNKSNKR